MSTQTLNETELLPDWDDNPACETPDHGTVPTGHGGDAVWRARIAAPCCKAQFTRLYCAPFKQWLLAFPNSTVSCPACRRSNRAILWHASAVWKPL